MPIPLLLSPKPPTGTKAWHPPAIDSGPEAPPSNQKQAEVRHDLHRIPNWIIQKINSKRNAQCREREEDAGARRRLRTLFDTFERSKALIQLFVVPRCVFDFQHLDSFSNSLHAAICVIHQSMHWYSLDSLSFSHTHVARANKSENWFAIRVSLNFLFAYFARTPSVCLWIAKIYINKMRSNARHHYTCNGR